MRRFLIRWRLLGLALACIALAPAVRADGALHALWEVHGKHNTVYLLGSIHVLRQSDYPLSPALLHAYGSAKSIYMEVNLADVDMQKIQTEMLASARLPEGETLLSIMGQRRYERAQELAREVGVDLGIFDAFEPWFVAEAISQMQLQQLGFQAKSGVEMYFLERARADGKPIAGLETVHEQIAMFGALSPDQQSDYLVSSLQESHELPKEVDEMVHAWTTGDTRWFAHQLKSEFGRDPDVYDALLVARNRKWIPKIEALLNDDRNYLVIVGTAHLVGQSSVIELLKKDGIVAEQH